MNDIIRTLQDKAARILIVRLSAFGDVLHVLPALEALHALLPSARFSWIAEELSAPILQGHPLLDEVIVLPRKTWQQNLAHPVRSCLSVLAAIRFFRELRRRTFSLALDFQGNLRGGMVTRLSGAAFSVGFHRKNCREWSHLLHKVSIPPMQPDVHRVTRNLAIPRFLGFQDDKPQPRLADMAREKQWAKAALNGSGRPVMIFHPGVSAFGTFKSWTREGFTELAIRAADTFQADIRLSWAPADRDMVEAIAAETGGKAAPAPACPDLRHLAALLTQADMVVAPDTGVLHLADVLGIPQVALFGPKDPAIYGPQHAPHRVVTSDIDCRPCKKRSCSHRRCMTDITAGQVLEAMQSLKHEVGHG